MSNRIYPELKELLAKKVGLTEAKFLLGIICYDDLSTMSSSDRKRAIKEAFSKCHCGGATPDIEVEKGMKLAQYVEVKKEYL